MPPDTNNKDSSSDMVFIDTGIKRLNSILTRKDDEGIAIPREIGKPSSTLVIKGSVGTGKSILASLIANNIHWKEVKIDNFITRVPFCIYFSFAQPANGILRYIEDVLTFGKNRRVDNENLKNTRPLIISPRDLGALVGANGLAVLRRNLIDLLSPFAYLQTLEPKKEADVANRAKKFVDVLNNSGDWDIPEKVFQKSVSVSGSLTDSEQERFELLPVVFVDPINVFLHFQDSRVVVSEIFGTFRRWGVPLVVLLEDAGEKADEAHRQLTSDIEFEADVLLHLADTGTKHKHRTIEVVKNRNAQPIHGLQTYRIENPEHSLWNVLNENDRTKHEGFIIFRSIHWFLSRSRDRKGAERKAGSTGIARLDHALTSKGDTEPPLPEDAFVLVRGEKGGHKLSVAFNILVAGLWTGDPERKHPENRKHTMLLSLGEETSIDISRIGLACSCTMISKNGERNQNANHIRWGTPPPDEENLKGEVGPKVIIHEWTYEDEEMSETKPLIEVTLKPGHLSPDEFLWIIETLLDRYKPKRVLLENTAHLYMRFPELHDQQMLFPALSSLTRSRNIMLIVTHVSGDGSVKELAYGLAACADYIVNVDGLNEEESSKMNENFIKEIDNILCKCIQIASKQPGHTWARMTVNNIRGKNYLQERLGVTVMQCSEFEGSKCHRRRPLIEKATSGSKASPEKSSSVNTLLVFSEK